MKITKQQLKQIIKEEIEIALNEMEVSGGNLPADHPARQGLKTEVEVLLDDIKKASVYDDKDPFAAVRGLLLETIKRMLTTSSDEDNPNSPLVYKDEVAPAMVELAELTMERDYETIRSNFNRMWTDMIRWHRLPGKPTLLPRISHNFRTIDTIIRNLPHGMK
jgi:hypothetical protein